MSAEGRWSPIVSVSNEFSKEQKQRAQALRVAREVCEERTPAKGAFTASGVSVSTLDLLDVAEWIVSGAKPELLPPPDLAVVP